VVDDCVFRGARDAVRIGPVGVEESMARAQAEAARLRRRLQGNAIDVRIDRRPFVRASHAHLGCMGASTMSAAACRRRPVHRATKACASRASLLSPATGKPAQWVSVARRFLPFFPA
jgi:hypothetical protein